MSDEEGEITGRSYVWKLTRAELEAELDRHNVSYEPATTTAQDLKRILSKYLKRLQSESLNQTSANATLRQVEAEIHHSTANREEIRSLPESRPASPPQPNTNDILQSVRDELSAFQKRMINDVQSRPNANDELLPAVRDEIVKMRKQIFNDMQAQETPKRKPVPSPRAREPLQTRHHQNRLDDDLRDEDECSPHRQATPRMYPHRIKRQSTTVVSQQPYQLVAL
ncbi:hypothetical protein PV326_000787, partial [Microctonus aethiopoides]